MILWVAGTFPACSQNHSYHNVLWTLSSSAVPSIPTVSRNLLGSWYKFILFSLFRWSMSKCLVPNLQLQSCCLSLQFGLGQKKNPTGGVSLFLSVRFWLLMPWLQFQKGRASDPCSQLCISSTSTLTWPTWAPLWLCLADDSVES